MDLFSRANLIARIVFGIFFVVMALGLIKDFRMVTGLMTSKGVPMANILLVITIAIWVIGALGLILNVRIQESILVLLALTIVVTPVIHNFWTASPEAAANEIQHFLKNVAIVAGLIALLGSLQS